MQKQLLLIFGLLMFLGSTAAAQEDMLSYGDTVLGTLDASYIFNGSAGDLVTIEVIGIDTDPTASLNAPDQQHLASSDAPISYRLPQDGVYTIVITGTLGQFVLRLNGQPLAVGQALTNVPTLADIPAGEEPQVFTFRADPAVLTTLNINATMPDFSFQAVIRDVSGQLVALIDQSTGVVLTLPPGEGEYTVEVASADPASSGQVSISTSAAVPSDEVCMVSAQGSAAVNVRSGPGVGFESLAQLEPGTRIVVTAVSGTWYQVERQFGIRILCLPHPAALRLAPPLHSMERGLGVRYLSDAKLIPNSGRWRCPV
jgi:hypothetical protein